MALRSASIWGAVIATAMLGLTLTAREGNAPARSAEQALPELRGEALADWQRRALNALLAPMLDAEQPGRWSRRSVLDPCFADGEVSVDGSALPYEAELPSKSFELKWRMRDCWPLGPTAIGFDGDIDLTIDHDDDRFDARVEPRSLVAKLDGRRYAVTQPFAARLFVTSASYPQ